MRENSFPRRKGSSLAQAVQGSDGVTIPGSAQKTSECGTWGPGLIVALAVLEERLDFMILGIFSNLKNSIILCFQSVCVRCRELPQDVNQVLVPFQAQGAVTPISTNYCGPWCWTSCSCAVLSSSLFPALCHPLFPSSHWGRAPAGAGWDSSHKHKLAAWICSEFILNSR